jgi:hypothetical protein
VDELAVASARAITGADWAVLWAGVVVAVVFAWLAWELVRGD